MSARKESVPSRVLPARPLIEPAGFSLVELLVALVVFLIVSGAAFSLYTRNQPLFTQEQNLAALNVGLRNAVAQLQIDLANSGTGFYVGANIPDFPIGVTLINNPAGTSCYSATTGTYTASCFDTLNIIATDPNTPPVHPEDIGSNCVSTTSSILFTQPGAGMTAAQTAALFHTGDQLLLVKSDGSQMTTTVLTKDGGVSGSKVQLQHNPTGANGTNGSLLDPLGISTNANNKLGTTFCLSDWVLKLAPITYQVDTSSPNNPKLTRTQSGITSVVSEQVIGFKVGATLWNSAAGTSSEQYNFDASTYGNPPGSDPYDYTLVRSVRVSLIGRTTPSTDPTYTFRNTFDGRAYQIQGASVVVNPRNLSMKD